MKIAWKLTLVNTVIFSTVILVLFYILYKSYERTLIRSEIAHMKRVIGYETTHPFMGHPFVMMGRARRFTRFFVAEIVHGNVEILNDPFGISEKFKPTRGIVEINGDHYLFLEIRRSPAVYYIGDDVSALMRALEKAKELGVVITSIGVGLSFLIGLLLSNMALSPLRKIISQLDGVDPRSLDKRLETPKSSDEISELVGRMNAMLDRIEKAYRSQERFVHDVSHELRNPIASMKGFLKILRKYGMKDEDIFEESTSELESLVDEMNSIIESLLILSKPDVEIEKVRTNVREIVEDVVKRFETDRIEIVSRADPVIETSPEMFSMIVKNLVENALKYSDSKVRVNIDENFVEISDEGPGIPEDKRELIFERFYRIDPSRDRRKKGHGLGLAIVKELCERLNLKIELESEIGKGSTFRVRWS